MLSFIEFFVVLILICIVWKFCRDTFKIAYYEAKLENRNIDIYDVKNMPFYKIWLN